MTLNCEEIAPATGDEFKPVLSKLWVMLLMFMLMVPGGAVATILWWFQIELPGEKVLSNKAGIVGMLAVPLGIVLSLVMLAILVSAKRLVMGENCVQLLTGERVAVHIPYHNIVETYATGEAGAGVVGIKLRDRTDPATRVPSWSKDVYEIQVLASREPLDAIHQSLIGRLAKFRAG